MATLKQQRDRCFKAAKDVISIRVYISEIEAQRELCLEACCEVMANYEIFLAQLSDRERKEIEARGGNTGVEACRKAIADCSK